MLLLQLSFFQKAGYVTRLVHFGEINFGLDFRLRSLVAAAGRAGLSRKMSADRFGFAVFNGRRMGLLVRYAQFRQYIQNSFRFDFKLFGQLIDSHPLSCFLQKFSPLSDHIVLTVIKYASCVIIVLTFCFRLMRRSFGCRSRMCRSRLRLSRFLFTLNFRFRLCRLSLNLTRDRIRRRLRLFAFALGLGF
jgi:hypothetical protein